MSQPIENYVPREKAEYFRKQAFRAWSIALFVVLSWVAAILLAPLAAGNNLPNVSEPVYRFFGFVCHQIPARSFHLEDHQFAVCTRCFGVYFGLLCGFAVYPFFRKIEEIEPLPRVWLFLAMIPMAADWLLGVLGLWDNTHFSRFGTGLILGTACAIFIVPALIEMIRLLSGKSRRRA